MSEQDDEDVYNFPRRINDPTLIIIFPIKQIVPTLLILLAVAYTGMVWIGLFLSGATFFGIGGILKNSYFDVLIHKLWSKGLLDVMVGVEKTSTVVNPLTKRFFN